MTIEPPSFERGAPPVEGPATIFVSDPSAEADRLSTALRGRGHTVIDVPLSLLQTRVAVQRPAVILLDVDAEGALEMAARLREIAGPRMDILFIGDAGKTLPADGDALYRPGSGFFVRPVQVESLLRQVEKLLGRRPDADADDLDAASSVGGSGLRGTSSLPPMRLAHAPLAEAWQRASPSTAPIAGNSPSQLPLPALSPEIEQLLHGAEQQSSNEAGPGSQPQGHPSRPSPEEEVEAVLPADVLAALDEPIDESDEFESDSGMSTGPARKGSTAGASTAGEGISADARPETSSPSAAPPASSAAVSPGAGRPKSQAPPGASTNPGRTDFGTSAGRSERPPGGWSTQDPKEIETPRPPRRAPSAAPPPEFPQPPRSPRDSYERASSRPPPPPAVPQQVGGSGPPTATQQALSLGPQSLGERPVRRTTTLPPPANRNDAPSVAPPATIGVPSVPEALGSGDALRAAATCIQQRAMGALCIDAPEGVRRILLRDGDVVTVASGIEGESLVGFLGARGDLARDAVSQLEGKIPAYGRHAGAALVANGHISQDQLWPVLRAHAEWVLGKALLAERGTASFELEPPGRLKAEPSVFGGATGAEVLIDVTRRVISSSTALTRLGGGKMRVAEGPRWDLVPECALSDAEQAFLARCKGSTLEQALATPDAGDRAALLYALVQLGVIVVERLDGAARARAARPAAASQFDAIDAQALRAQVTTRLSLIEEADYFTLLGVARTATPYDIHRAYLELRRTFSPNRVLTAATADLAEDLELILEVLEEAHDVLRDQTRRERYRRAIEGDPPG